MRASRMRRARFLAMLGIVASLIVVGCGSSDDNGGSSSQSSDERAVRAKYKEFSDALYAKDVKAACGAMTEETQRRYAAVEPAKRTCEQRIASLADPQRLSKNRPRIVKLRVRGNKASAWAKTKNSNRYRIPFVKRDGEWRIAGF